MYTYMCVVYVLHYSHVRTCWYVRGDLTHRHAQTQQAWCNTRAVSGRISQRLGWMAVCQSSLIYGRGTIDQRMLGALEDFLQQCHTGCQWLSNVLPSTHLLYTVLYPHLLPQEEALSSSCCVVGCEEDHVLSHLYCKCMYTVALSDCTMDHTVN